MVAGLLVFSNIICCSAHLPSAMRALISSSSVWVISSVGCSRQQWGRQCGQSCQEGPNKLVLLLLTAAAASFQGTSRLELHPANQAWQAGRPPVAAA